MTAPWLLAFILIAPAQTVERVIDGDTLVLSGVNGAPQVIVRLVGVDAPEMASRRGKAQCYALRSAGWLAKEATGKQVIFEQDTSEGADAQDHFGRSLGYIYLPDGRLVNGELVRLGLARAYTRFPFGYKAQFLAYERAARNRKIGVWGKC